MQMLKVALGFCLGALVRHCWATQHTPEVDLVTAVAVIAVLGFIIRPYLTSDKRGTKDADIDAKYWADQLQLAPHPEGGKYREFYRCSEDVGQLPRRYGDNARRAFGTHIYFLLEAGEPARFHRLKSDEIWNLVDGGPITIFIINKRTGNLEEHHLGKHEKLRFSTIVPAESFYAIRVKDPAPNGYALVTCSVCPGFIFDDFELASRGEMLRLYPQHEKVILDMTSG